MDISKLGLTRQAKTLMIIAGLPFALVKLRGMTNLVATEATCHDCFGILLQSSLLHTQVAMQACPCHNANTQTGNLNYDLNSCLKSTLKSDREGSCVSRELGDQA